MDIGSMALGFLVGAATGATGTYFAHKYTDRRREKEAGKQAKKHFLKIKEQMPKLIEEMRADLLRDGNACVREFFVLEDKKVVLGGSEKDQFVYYEDNHENLRGQLDILESEGYIFEVPHGNVPIYRMTEEFVQLLMKLK